MRLKLPKTIIVVFFFLILEGNSLFAQKPMTLDYSNLKLKSSNQLSILYSNTQGASNAYIIIGTLVVLFATPTIIYENKKIHFGLGREISLTFGKIGEFRISAEYSFIFRSRLKHHFRTSFKYDILSELEKTEWISSRNLISIGAGYFLDAEGGGIFPEISAGFRIGEDVYFIYPYIKLRHTFMTKKDKPDNTDFSLGMAIGFKPF